MPAVTDWRPATREQVRRREVTKARAVLDSSLSEAQFQASVVDLAERRQWRAWHDNDPRRNRAGFPDWVFLRPPRLLFVELKKQGGYASPDQRIWLAELSQCVGVESYLWRPSDWPEIKEVLL